MNKKAQELAMHQKDTGSSEVQIALLTEKIETLSTHIKQFKKDKHSSVGLMTAPEQEKAEETFANSMGTEKEEPKYQDTDTLVNTMSGGLNSQKKTYPRVSPGDNPMAMEDKITEEDLANSLRAQYEGFKKAYQEAAKPDYIDLDKDGNKTEPMKKAAKDKEAKEKK